jgi:hypothetical protein
MIGITEASAALSGIKTAVDMLKGVQALKSESDVNQAIINIQRVLLDAQSSALSDKEKQMELIARIDELERKIAEDHDRQADKKRYKLTEFPTGRFAYVLREGDSSGEPPHKLCAKCFEEGQKSILQVRHKHSGGESVQCPRCKETIVLSAFPEVKVERVSRRNSWMGY